MFKTIRAILKPMFVFVSLLALQGSLVAKDFPVSNSNITEAEVEAAQKAWGAALIQISTDYKEGGIEKAKATANKV